MISMTYQTQFGEELFIVGSLPMFGSWDPNSGVKLQWSEGHKWYITIDLLEVKNTNFEFKFVVRNTNNGQNKWEGGNNHAFNWSSQA